MGDEKYPYVNHMNILHDPLELIDIHGAPLPHEPDK
jgi:hypothetical protein